MGTVYEALDARLDRKVAIKLLRPELFHDAGARMRFEREAKTLTHVEHPGVVRLFDSGELDDGVMYLIMERLVGLDLGTLIRLDGPGSPIQVARLLKQGAAALTAAHRNHVIHRDIKPQNLFMQPSLDGYQVKILDFGVAKSQVADVQLTRTGFLIGTPTYMAPEQILGHDADSRSDLYSFACVVYEALVGQSPVQGHTLPGIINEVLHQAAQPPSRLRSGLSVEIDRAFEQALEKDPEGRTQDLLAWADDLAEHLEACAVPVAGWSVPALANQDANEVRVSSAIVPGSVSSETQIGGTPR